MNSKSPVTDYRHSHTQPAKGTVYDSRLYAEDSAHTSLWRMEREYLADLLERFVPEKNKYLDFACGTGRIIASLAEYFTQVQGVDVSESMLSVARQKNIKAKLLCADISKNKDIIKSDFNLITAFRFFLNAQDSLRREVVSILAEKLAPDGILVFNIHNSKPSFLWLQNNVTHIFGGKKIPSMSRSEVTELLKGTGLEIVETTAFGIIPKAAHLLLRTKLWILLDQLLAKIGFLQLIGSDTIYVCRAKKA